jgi:hypothetical protein
MNDFFNLRNWTDLINDSGFWNAIVILFIVAAAVLAGLYSSDIQHWRAEREERVKWVFWNH